MVGCGPAPVRSFFGNDFTNNQPFLAVEAATGSALMDPAGARNLEDVDALHTLIAARCCSNR